MWLAPLFLGLWQGRNIMVEGHGGGKLLSSWQPRSREKVITNNVFQEHILGDLHPLTRPHLLTVYSAMNSSMSIVEVRTFIIPPPLNTAMR
jgi:hypothetical protein